MASGNYAGEDLEMKDEYLSKDTVKNLIERGWLPSESPADIECSIRFIEHLPPADAKPAKWIPCSERLPKNCQYVLVTFGKYKWVDTDEFNDGHFCYHKQCHSMDAATRAVWR